jgi:septum site-determining protein MinC
MGSVSIKGSSAGLMLQIEFDATFEGVLEELSNFSEGATFFKGGTIVGIKGKNFSFSQKNEIYKVLKDKLALNVESLDNIMYPTVAEKEIVTKEVMVNTILPTKIHKGTMRSGNSIENEGDVIIIGDVNPGAQIKSKGNIIVLGSLKGIAHAGVDGSTDKVVIALDLEPMQLGIGNIISRAPDDGYEKPQYAEVAYIKNDNIIIETAK